MRIAPFALVALLTAAPVFAADPAPVDPSAPARTATADESREQEVDRNCLKETGTRIRARAADRRCSAFAGRVYTREDITRTGEVDIAQALRRLDPSIY
jgi:hypothetical protein